ncbi:DUF814-containing protein [Aureococcus anophagefferens]|nr:DUF814-containing protein [Aureococcus anophagefferens]
MVFYFTADAKDPKDGEDYVVYMGADKFENEGLIEWGQKRDVWFHVDGLSSAHVYLRLPLKNAQCDPDDHRCAGLLDRIPEGVVEDMCQLVKANSIEGCKKGSVMVAHTPWANSQDETKMQTGAVGFHDNRHRVPARRPATSRRSRIEKTRARHAGLPRRQGERALHQALCLLIAIAPEAAAATVALVPEYGSWRDLCVLYDALGDASNLRDAARARAEELRSEIAAASRTTRTRGRAPSLAAKYAPREHKQHQALSGRLAAALFPGDGRRREKYRKAVATLSRALDVPEIKMCGKRWAELDVAAVPSRCLAKSRKAFLNEALKGGALEGPKRRATVVALVDVSGSMGHAHGRRVALGLLVSRRGARLDRFLTFESEPRWHALDATASPVEKMRAARAAPWGGSTSFAKALDRVLDACVEHKLAPEEIPDLIVFSDMQFDQAEGYGGRDAPWTTWHERFVKKFADAGLRVRGARWDAPAITYWNLRGDTRGGFLAEHDKPGVRLLSGFSPALLKLVLGGEEEEDVVVVNADGTASVVKAKPTPYATLRRALDDGRYDAVRTALAGLESGAFAAASRPPPSRP